MKTFITFSKRERAYHEAWHLTKPTLRKEVSWYLSVHLNLGEWKK